MVFPKKRGIVNKILAILVIMMVSLMASAYPVCAQGLGVAPVKIEIRNAFRGGEYERTITVFNRYEDTRDFALSAAGEMNDWISFYAQDEPTTSIGSITIPGKSAYILVKFQIPEDTAVGSYTSAIVVESIPTEELEGETAESVKLQLSVAATIEVIGKQILTGIVRGITTRDTEVNYPLRIMVEFKNTGNVVAKPQIDVNITKDATLIDSLTFAEAKVKVEAREVIPVEWDTTGEEIGDYVASVTVSLDGNILDTKDLAFKILPLGTLTRWGELTELSYDGQLEIGRVVRILATFKNTGEIDALAKFAGEVYRDDALIDTVNSEEILIPVKESDILTSYLKLNHSGSYQIKGYVVYDGKMTDVKEVSFEVASGQSWFGSQGLLLTGIAAIAMIALTGVVIYKRRNNKARSKSQK